MNKLISAIIMVIVLLLIAFGIYEFMGSDDKNGDKPGSGISGKTVVFDITAQRFRFDPEVIRAQEGDDVIINVTSIDTTHGFTIKELGINETINKGETKQIRFKADKTGTFTFFCSIPCGPGHNEMKGSLAVSSTDSSVIPDSTGNILSLKNKGLEKLPADVLKMTSLTSLDISENALTGALPAEIRFLKNLKKLDASDNLMTGIPAEIGQLSELEELDYSNNYITGLPLELGNLKKLRTLNLSGNKYSTMDLAQIKASLPGLKIIGE